MRWSRERRHGFSISSSSVSSRSHSVVGCAWHVDCCPLLIPISSFFRFRFIGASIALIRFLSGWAFGMLITFGSISTSHFSLSLYRSFRVDHIAFIRFLSRRAFGMLTTFGSISTSQFVFGRSTFVRINEITSFCLLSRLPSGLPREPNSF